MIRIEEFPSIDAQIRSYLQVVSTIEFVLADRFSGSRGSLLLAKRLRLSVTSQWALSRLASCITRKRNIQKESPSTFATTGRQRAHIGLTESCPPRRSVSFGRQYGHLIWQRVRWRHWQILAINKTFPCLLSWGYLVMLRGLPFSMLRARIYRGLFPFSFCLSFSFAFFFIAASFHLTRHLSTRLQASVPHDRHDVPGVPRKGKPAHRRSRVLNGRVLIGPRSGVGTSGCPRVEFPPWRLLPR